MGGLLFSKCYIVLRFPWRGNRNHATL